MLAGVFLSPVDYSKVLAFTGMEGVTLMPLATARSSNMYVCMYVWMDGCMYVRMYVCMHVCMYVCMYLSTHQFIHPCMHACIHPSIHSPIHPSIQEQSLCPADGGYPSIYPSNYPSIYPSISRRLARSTAFPFFRVALLYSSRGMYGWMDGWMDEWIDTWRCVVEGVRPSRPCVRKIAESCMYVRMYVCSWLYTY